jgi:hypothetical protein
MRVVRWPLPVAAVVVGAAILVASVAMPAWGPRTRPAPAPRWDLPVRMVAATAVVLLLTGLAPLLGPRWTGLLSPLPVFAAVLGVFVHRAEGSAAAARLLRGVVLGSLAHAAMFVVIAGWLPDEGLALTYVLAGAAAIATNGVILLAVARRL